MKKVHIIGVAGVAMSATAKLLKDDGWQVSGSDAAFYPPASDYVEKLGIDFKHDYSPDNIPDDVDLVIIGRNAKLTPETNAEVESAFERELNIKSFPEVIAEIMADQHRVVVAGSYGKSTVTSLLAWILIHAEKDPSYFIGAYPIDMEYTSAKGAGDVAVMEGDEYPTAHWDDSSKFQHLNADDVLLTAVDHDHINVFPTYKDYVQPFIELLRKIPEHGLLVACADNEGVMNIVKHAPQYITYGLSEEALWRADNINYGETTTFDLVHDGEVVVQLHTHLLGAHNVQNIVGVAALLLTREIITPEELAAALASFSGVRRRLNKITNASAVPAYEGFGTSYEKAESAIAAIRLHYPDNKLVVLFEPHTFSLRNRDTLERYDSVFNDTDAVIVFEPATQGAGTHKQLSQEEIVDRIKATGLTTHMVHDEKDVHEALEQELTKDSALLILSSGNFEGVLDTLPQWLDTNFS